MNQSTPKTNSNSRLVALLLKDARVGTFTGLVTTKKGATRGKGADKKTYGDDTVHVTILTGFSYQNLVKKSLAALSGITDKDILGLAESRRTAPGEPVPVTMADIAEARAELEESFRKSLDGTAEATTDHVYEPLTVDGETVRGARVYKCVASTGVKCHCRNCTGDEKAPLPGTIYLQGLQIHSAILVPAVNGPIPASKSAAKTVAKDLFRSKLPVRRYVSYALEPGTNFMLRAGGTAAIEAEKRGFVVTDELLDAIARVA